MGVNVTPLLLKQSSRKLNPCLRKSRRLHGAHPQSALLSRMRKRLVPVPRAHVQTAVSALRATIAPRVQRLGVDPPMAIVRPVLHAPSVSVPLPASAPRVHSMTAVRPQSDPLVVSALTANVRHMATVWHVVNVLTASVHRAPVVPNQIALVPTALPLTGRALTALVVTSVPLVSDPVVRHARSMIAPATASVLRAR